MQRRIYLIILTLAVGYMAAAQTYRADSVRLARIERVDSLKQLRSERVDSLKQVRAERADTLAARTAATNQKVQQALRDWDYEEEEKDIDLKPKVVTGGLIICPNVSNFIITHWQSVDSRAQHFSSKMRIGVEIGGFMDFLVSKHFAIQPQFYLVAEQNRFRTEGEGDHLWSIGFNIPVYFLGRIGNKEKGYLSLGAGPFTHFTVASNLGYYEHNAEQPQPLSANLTPDEQTFDFRLHDNHSGLGALVSYEFPIGLQLMATYRVSLSDIAYFKEENPEASFDIYPQHVAMGIAYRFK